MADSASNAESAPLKPVQLLWINLIMDTLAAVALATEPPYIGLLEYKPYDRNESLMTPYSARRAILQVVLQTITFLLILYLGEPIFDSAGDKPDEGRSGYSRQHLTIVFNCFVLSQLFNEFNSRKVRNTKNVFSRLYDHRTFQAVWLAAFVIQVLMVTFGGDAIKVERLSLTQWLRCLGVGVLPLLWTFLFNLLPESYVNSPLAGPPLLRKMWRRCFRRRVDQEEEEEEERGAEERGRDRVLPLVATEADVMEQREGKDIGPSEETPLLSSQPGTTVTSARLNAERWQRAWRQPQIQRRWYDLVDQAVSGQLDIVRTVRRHHR